MKGGKFHKIDLGLIFCKTFSLNGNCPWVNWLSFKSLPMMGAGIRKHIGGRELEDRQIKLEFDMMIAAGPGRMHQTDFPKANPKIEAFGSLSRAAPYPNSRR
jgi:hypothetical protein